MYKKLVIILIIFFTNTNILSNEIIFNKNDVIITKENLKNYKLLYKDYSNKEISDGSAIKNIYMMFKIIDLQIERNPKFNLITEDLIKKDLKQFKNKYTEIILKYFLKYEILKNDFLANYIKNYQLSKYDGIINEKINFYEDKECTKYVHKISFHKINENEKQLILVNNSKVPIKVNENKYICLKDENIYEINSLINNIISKDGYDEFLKYVYKNVK